MRVVSLGLLNIEPWQILHGSVLQERFKGIRSRYPSRDLVPFAARVDNDDVVCWDGQAPGKICVIHDYASVGFEQRAEFDDFWDWFRAAIEYLVNFS